MIDDGPPYNLGSDFYLGERVVYRQFECARCKTVCTTTTTEAEANREFLGSGINDGSEIRSVCDDCYEYVMTRVRADGLLGGQP